MLQPEGAHLLRQIERVAVLDRAHRLCAAHEEGRRSRTMARLAGALLAIHLLFGTIDFASREHLVCAGAALRELPYDDSLQEIGARLESKNGIVEFDVACCVPIEMEDFRLHDVSPSCCAGAAPLRSALRTEAGSGAASGRGRLAASRTITQPPLCPGTAPRIMISPRSTSTLATSRFCVVTRSTP